MFDKVKPVTHMLGLVGDSITASYTPPMHEMMGKAMGMGVAYRPIDLAVLDIGPEDLAETLVWARRLGFTGLNITAPCKQQVISLLDELSPRVEGLRAVNTVVFRDGKTVGYNTDWCGFVNSFKRSMPEERPDTIVLMGAGGAGSAVAYGMLDHGVRQVIIFDVMAERQTALVTRMNELFEGDRAVAGTDLQAALAQAEGVINATTIGMTGHEAGTSVPIEYLRPEMWVADCVYLPVETELLRRAKERGCRTLPGTGMAVEQAIEAFRLFTGVEPDPASAYDALQQLLASRDG
ncbi:MAG: shikimate dehydrogenase [Propioniciclava sp.]|uniref:shikimate dehydrogenase n=1 Tax=Propioniciclava sp. TaxID=2038686 RepID=UPI0039E6EF0F